MAANPSTTIITIFHKYIPSTLEIEKNGKFEIWELNRIDFDIGNLYFWKQFNRFIAMISKLINAGWTNNNRENMKLFVPDEQLENFWNPNSQVFDLIKPDINKFIEKMLRWKFSHFDDSLWLTCMYRFHILMNPLSTSIMICSCWMTRWRNCEKIISRSY